MWANRNLKKGIALCWNRLADQEVWANRNQSSMLSKLVERLADQEVWANRNKIVAQAADK